MHRETSRELYAEAQRHLAGGVSTIMRADAKPFPLYFESGAGSRITDVDGNEYLDYTLAFGPLILGHSHPAVVEAVVEQVRRGQTYGAQHRLEPLVARALRECLPWADLVVFSNTGTEAVQVALRTARAAASDTGFPLNVPACTTSLRAMSSRKARRPATQLRGKPAAIALP